MNLDRIESSQIGTFEIPARKAYPKNQPEKSFDQREKFSRRFFEEEEEKKKSNDKKTEKLEIFKLLASDH